MGKTTVCFHGAVFYLENSGSLYEAEEIGLVKEHLKKGDKTVVAGFGLGWVALNVAAVVGIDNVFCLEPNKDLVELAQGVQLGYLPFNVQWGAIVSPTAPFQCFYLGDMSNWARSGISFFYESGGRWTPAFSIDKFINRGFTNFVLDIEGGEKLLFNCTNDNLKQMGTLIVEAHINVLGRDTVNQLIKHLESGFNEVQYHDLGNHTAYIVAKNRETIA